MHEEFCAGRIEADVSSAVRRYLSIGMELLCYYHVRRCRSTRSGIDLEYDMFTLSGILLAPLASLSWPDCCIQSMSKGSMMLHPGRLLGHDEL